MGEGLKALLGPHKAPVITDLYHMGDPMVLPYKTAPEFKGSSNNISPRCALEPTIKTLGMSAQSAQLIGVAEDLHHQGRLKCFGGVQSTTARHSDISASRGALTKSS